MAKNQKIIKVLVVEDHLIVRQGLIALLKENPRLEVVGEATEGEEAICKAIELKPDLVILDLFLKGQHGNIALAKIHQRLPQVKILVLTMYGHESYIRSSIQAGANGYILKGSGISEILDAIERIMQGESYFSPALSAQIAQALPANISPPVSPLNRLGLLTHREKEVLQLIGEGLTSSRVAGRLSISVKTVETHRTNIIQKLDIHNTAGLVKYAISAGLVPPLE